MPKFYPFMRRKRALLSVWLLSVGLSSVHAASAERSDTARSAFDWRASGRLLLRESFDSNVFLQDTVPTSPIANVVPDRRASLVSTVGATVTLERRFAPELNVAINYAPEAIFYHSASSENHRLHRLGVAAGSQSGGATWSFQNSATWIDGGEEGPVFGCAGGATALGGIPVRDRRAAWFGRSAFKLTRTIGPWFVRPVATAYMHDFATRQSRQPGYLNYLDRQEFGAGFDFGRELAPKTWLVAGFRAARQDQLKLHGVDSPYDSWLQRYLVGIEGAPWPWLRLNLLTGPETRHFNRGTPAGFDRDNVLWWIDGAATVTVSARDACTLTVRRFLQPAFSSPSVYEDITYEISWRRKLAERLTLGAGFKAYGGDWPGPATREDWIFTPSALLHYTLNRKCSVELSYAAETAHSRLPATPGREYQRHLGMISTQFAF